MSVFISLLLRSPSLFLCFAIMKVFKFGIAFALYCIVTAEMYTLNNEFTLFNKNYSTWYLCSKISNSIYPLVYSTFLSFPISIHLFSMYFAQSLSDYCHKSICNAPTQLPNKYFKTETEQMRNKKSATIYNVCVKCSRHKHTHMNTKKTYLHRPTNTIAHTHTFKAAHCFLMLWPRPLFCTFFLS